MGNAEGTIYCSSADYVFCLEEVREVFGERPGHVNGSDKSLIDLWDKVKSKVCQLDVRDYQVADWFKRNYCLDVRLSDFDHIEPPSQITAESLKHFLKTLERHADHSW